MLISLLFVFFCFFFWGGGGGGGALLAPTITTLKLQLNIVKSRGNQYSVKINPDKSKLLVFG